MSGGKTLGLCMIVKDEAAIIERCLASVRPLIDHWVICDTGSTDDTRERIRAVLDGVPGELHDSPWVDFGHNRSDAIARARGTADYLLLLDADMVAEAGPSFDPEALTADAYLLRYSGPLDYRQVLLVRGDLPWHYVGVTHEYLHAETPYSIERLDGLVLHHLTDGANRADKLERDRDLLTARVAEAPEDARALFYLAQTHHDLGAWDEAIESYERRIGMGGWEEEVWYARYRIATARLARGDAWPEVLDALLAAWAARPSRLEPLYIAARHYREAEQYALGHLLSRPILDATYPEDILFVEREVYRYLLAFEHAICCYWVEDHAQAIRIDNGLLDLPDLPPEHVEAVIRNRRCSLDLRPPDPIPEERRRWPRLRVVTPFFNAGRLLEACVESVMTQTADGFEAIFVDDGSTDGFAAAVPEADPRVTLLRNPTRVGPLVSLRQTVLEHCRPDEVVVVLPGEDRLATADALATIRETYATREAWITYGQFEHPDGHRGSAKPFPDAATFARSRNLPGHLGPPLTFRAGLLRLLAERDPVFDCLRDPDGRWHRQDLEAVLGPPLLELAGLDRVAFLDVPLAVCHRSRWRGSEGGPIPRAREERFMTAASWD